MVKVKQKVRFLGAPRQIYHIGRSSFPYNVWVEVTPDELKHLTGNDAVRTKFDYDPPVNFSELKAEPKVGRKKKRKED